MRKTETTAPAARKHTVARVLAFGMAGVILGLVAMSIAVTLAPDFEGRLKQQGAEGPMRESR